MQLHQKLPDYLKTNFLQFVMALITTDLL
jgi:hypothetical protein